MGIVWSQFLEKTVLSDNGVGGFLCENILFMVSGFNAAQTNDVSSVTV